MSMPLTRAFTPPPGRGLRRATFWLGFALGGFLDGILLHQILQWHHLLSGLPGERWRELRLQVLADGLFHAAHYLLAAAGLAGLWRYRAALASPGSGNWVAGSGLLGFGAWHLLDAVVSHWVLGLHHIREGSTDWLFWDLVFFALGLVTALAGFALLRRGGGGGTGPAGSGAVAAALLAIAVLASAPAAALPARGTAPLDPDWRLPAFCFTRP
jgi:uncharacterized membrane protein